MNLCILFVFHQRLNSIRVLLERESLIGNRSIVGRMTNKHRTKQILTGLANLAAICIVVTFGWQALSSSDDQETNVLSKDGTPTDMKESLLDTREQSGFTRLSVEDVSRPQGSGAEKQMEPSSSSLLYQVEVNPMLSFAKDENDEGDYSKEETQLDRTLKMSRKNGKGMMKKRKKNKAKSKGMSGSKKSKGKGSLLECVPIEESYTKGKGSLSKKSKGKRQLAEDVFGEFFEHVDAEEIGGIRALKMSMSMMKKKSMGMSKSNMKSGSKKGGSKGSKGGKGKGSKGSVPVSDADRAPIRSYLLFVSQ